jgi:hypothetical protein
MRSLDFSIDLILPSTVGVATVYGLDDGGFRVQVPVGSRIFSANLLVPEILSPGVKGPGHESDNSPPTSAEVDLYIHSLICLHGLVLN